MVVPDEKIGYRPPRIHASDPRSPNLCSLLFYKIENKIIFYEVTNFVFKKLKSVNIKTRLYSTLKHFVILFKNKITFNSRLDQWTDSIYL